jgi:hypothetical protein
MEAINEAPFSPSIITSSKTLYITSTLGSNLPLVSVVEWREAGQFFLRTTFNLTSLFFRFTHPWSRGKGADHDVLITKKTNSYVDEIASFIDDGPFASFYLFYSGGNVSGSLSSADKSFGLPMRIRRFLQRIVLMKKVLIHSQMYRNSHTAMLFPFVLLIHL